MLREYIYRWVGYVDRGSPAWGCPSVAAGFSGSPPGAAPPVPLPLVRLGCVGLWWLEPGRCALTDAAYLLSHPGCLVKDVWDEASKPPAHLWFTFPQSKAAWLEQSFSIPSPHSSSRS